MGSTWQFMFGICQNFAAENLTLYAMNLITIEESAWKALMEQLQSIENQLNLWTIFLYLGKHPQTPYQSIGRKH